MDHDWKEEDWPYLGHEMVGELLHIDPRLVSIE